MSMFDVAWTLLLCTGNHQRRPVPLESTTSATDALRAWVRVNDPRAEELCGCVQKTLREIDPNDEGQ